MNGHQRLQTSGPRGQNQSNGVFCLAMLSRHVERFELGTALGQVFPEADPEVGSLVQVVS